MYGSLSNSIIVQGFQYPVGPSELVPVAPLANDVDVPVESSVHLTVTNAVNVALASLVITIGGETAYSDGAVQPGWRGAVTPFNANLDVVLTRLRSFSPSEQVTVEATWDQA
jgi:hypothetical protein